MMAQRKRFFAYSLAVALAVGGTLGLNRWLDARLRGDPEFRQGPERKLGWFRDAKFGLMIHWGPASLLGTEMSWSRSDHRGEAGSGPVATSTYDRLYERFNPVEFNADEWARVAKSAGAKYLVFVTKHHDGFCMFDSRLTDYTVLHSPLHRDVTAEVADACRRAGLRLGFYYSQPDWHHPDYHAGRHARYIQYLDGQISELCTNYGRVDVLWFDGLYWRTWDWDSPGLFRLVHELQPGALINDRAGFDGDFATLEQGAWEYETRRAWESCITLGEQWSWKPGDKLKSSRECVEKLVRCVGGGGNLLLNIGPRPDGHIDPPQVECLEAIGAWLRSYGESIYGTRAGPLKPGPWGVSTHRGHTVYLHLLKTGELTLPPLPSRVLSAKLLTPGEFTLDQAENATRISVKPTDPSEIDNILVLHMRGHVFAN